MRKNIKKVMYFIILFLMIPLVGHAADTEVISLVVDAKISKNRVAEVNENIFLYILNKTDEYERILDKKIYPLDKSLKYSNIKINNISSNNLKKANSNSKTEKVLFEVNGQKYSIQNIKLNYKYSLKSDNSKKYDEFYYNIVNESNSISDLTFKIELPNDADIKNINFGINGDYNVKDKVNYTIKDNVISGFLNETLEANKTLSIRIELPNNYFLKAYQQIDYIKLLYLILPIISLIVIFIFWNKYAKGNKIVRAYTYSPPDNFDPVEIGFLYKGSINENDVASIILFLANNGYLKIEEFNDGYKVGTENTFRFIKIKDYDGNNAIQKLIFEGIFKNKNTAYLENIENTYSKKLEDARIMIDNKNNRLKLFNAEINQIKFVSMLLLILSIVNINIVPTFELANSYWFIPLSSFIMFFGFYIIDIKGIFKTILGIIFVGGITILSISALLTDKYFLTIYVIQLILIIISWLLYRRIPVRTKFGNEKLGETEGFKMTLQSMGKIKFEEKLKENPNYYYDMVPYAYVFGILNEWMSKGKKTITSRPSWHISQEQFDLAKECKFYKNVIYTTSKIMIKSIYSKKLALKIEKKPKIQNNID